MMKGHDSQQHLRYKDHGHEGAYDGSYTYHSEQEKNRGSFKNEVTRTDTTDDKLGIKSEPEEIAVSGEPECEYEVVEGQIGEGYTHENEVVSGMNSAEIEAGYKSLGSHDLKGSMSGRGVVGGE